MSALPPEDRLQRLLQGLDELPPLPGISFRGRSPEARFGRPGEVAVTMGLLPTSRDGRVATENFRVGALYAVIGRTGRFLKQLSARPDEEEVLFRPGTMLRAGDTVQLGDLAVTFVHEFSLDAPPQPRDVTADLRRIAAALEGARRRPEVAVGVPGKFLGDIA